MSKTRSSNETDRVAKHQSIQVVKKKSPPFLNGLTNVVNTILKQLFLSHLQSGDEEATKPTKTAV